MDKTSLVFSQHIARIYLVEVMSKSLPNLPTGAYTLLGELVTGKIVELAQYSSKVLANKGRKFWARKIVKEQFVIAEC